MGRDSRLSTHDATRKRWVERALRPVPSEIKKRRGVEGRHQRKHQVRQLVRPQSRGLRAGSDVSRFAVHPRSHCAKYRVADPGCCAVDH
jgi:hypothetical protein